MMGRGRRIRRGYSTSSISTSASRPATCSAASTCSWQGARRSAPDLQSHRPAIDRPRAAHPLLIVGYCYGMRSERRLSEEVADRLTFRWFCRLDLDDKVPDHSTFYRIRHGRFRDSDVLRHVFERVVLACCTAGLVGGEDFAVDASLIEPDADKGRSIPRAEWRQERSCHSEPRREGVSGDTRRRCLRRSYRGHPEVRLALRSRRAMDRGDEERRLFRLGGVKRHH